MAMKSHVYYYYCFGIVTILYYNYLSNSFEGDLASLHIQVLINDTQRHKMNSEMLIV